MTDKELLIQLLVNTISSLSLMAGAMDMHDMTTKADEALQAAEEAGYRVTS